MNEILNACNNELMVEGIFCDLENCVIYDTLKLETYGITWNIILTLKADIRALIYRAFHNVLRDYKHL
jgi:hypothetical protein